MATFVLIHGAMHGAWCWAKIVPLLQKHGHTVIAPDLPGHGLDKAPVAEQSLQTYVNRVCEIIDAQSEPVILVGHSMSGLTISQAAEYRPDKIRTLVYLTARLQQSGETRPMAPTPDRIISEDGRTFMSRLESLKDRYYNDCSDEDVAWAAALLGWEILSLAVTPVTTSDRNFGRVPRVFIECLQDRIIPLARQREMYTIIGVQKIYTLDTSHSPFLSAPVDLANHLLDIADLRFGA